VTATGPSGTGVTQYIYQQEQAGQERRSREEENSNPPVFVSPTVSPSSPSDPEEAAELHEAWGRLGPRSRADRDRRRKFREARVACCQLGYYANQWSGLALNREQRDILSREFQAGLFAARVPLGVSGTPAEDLRRRANLCGRIVGCDSEVEFIDDSRIRDLAQQFTHGVEQRRFAARFPTACNF
jgi:hypothetical protein